MFSAYYLGFRLKFPKVKGTLKENFADILRMQITFNWEWGALQKPEACFSTTLRCALVLTLLEQGAVCIWFSYSQSGLWKSLQICQCYRPQRCTGGCKALTKDDKAKLRRGWPTSLGLGNIIRNKKPSSELLITAVLSYSTSGCWYFLQVMGTLHVILPIYPKSTRNH